MSAAVSLPPPMRTVAEDGCIHFSDLKQLGRSGAHYLERVNTPRIPTRPMLVSTAVHELILGPRHGKQVVRYEGKTRQGEAWKLFAAQHAGSDILTAPEWDDAKEMAAAINDDPLVRARLDGARTEVPLTWEEGDVRCSTSGVDIINAGALGDLKGTHNAEPKIFERTAFRLSYHAQLAWYRRGALVNGIAVDKGLFVLGYEMTPPYAVVDFELTEGLIDFGDRQIALWMERLRVLRESIPEPRAAKDWPAYVQSPTPWDVPSWMQGEDEDDEEEEAA